MAKFKAERDHITSLLSSIDKAAVQLGFMMLLHSQRLRTKALWNFAIAKMQDCNGFELDEVWFGKLAGRKLADLEPIVFVHTLNKYYRLAKQLAKRTLIVYVKSKLHRYLLEMDKHKKAINSRWAYIQELVEKHNSDMMLVSQYGFIGHNIYQFFFFSV